MLAMSIWGSVFPLLFYFLGVFGVFIAAIPAGNYEK